MAYHKRTNTVLAENYDNPILKKNQAVRTLAYHHLWMIAFEFDNLVFKNFLSGVDNYSKEVDVSVINRQIPNTIKYWNELPQETVLALLTEMKKNRGKATFSPGRNIHDGNTYNGDDEPYELSIGLNLTEIAEFEFLVSRSPRTNLKLEDFEIEITHPEFLRMFAAPDHPYLP